MKQTVVSIFAVLYNQNIFSPYYEQNSHLQNQTKANTHSIYPHRLRAIPPLSPRLPSLASRRPPLRLEPHRR